MGSRARAGGLAALVLALGLGAAGRDAWDDWVAATALPALTPATSVEVRDHAGALLRVYTVADGRWRLPPGPVDPAFARMLIAYEDGRFLRHNGVDPLALLRAAWQGLASGRIRSGGSTLTMQVARLLEDSGTGRWSGKLRQMRLAWALERQLDKAAILRLYLLHAPYGGNIEGLRAATLAWFGKEPARLTPAERALLVALPQAPEARRPDRHPQAARAARDRVLARMHAAGLLEDGDYRAALRDPTPQARRPFPAIAPHLADRARRQDPTAARHDLTLDAGLQQALERLAAQALRGRPQGLSLAILVADHRTGAVLASVGGSYSEAGQGYVDMTRALRSPGSTLKPLVYGMAFDEGLAHPETMIDDRPISFDGYAPQNFDGQYRGAVRITEALQWSLNTPVVQLADALGPETILARLRRAGLAPQVPGGRAGLAITLGGLGLTLEDLVQLYADLAQGGAAPALHWQLGTGGGPGARILTPASAWQVGHILAGLAPPPGAPRNRLAYKTGTSYGHRDAWALGFDGRHVVGVWIGRPDGTPVPGAFGAEAAAPVLFEAFQRLKPALDPLPPPPPATLMLSAAALPAPLQRFRPRGAVFAPAPDAPAVAFPPEGAALPLAPGGLVAKVREGRPPFTWLANGRPLLTNARDREVILQGLEAGYTDLSVIDAEGRAARVSVRLE